MKEHAQGRSVTPGKSLIILVGLDGNTKGAQKPEKPNRMPLNILVQPSRLKQEVPGMTSC